MKDLLEYLPFIIPIFIVEMALMITALVHVLRHPKYRFGNRALWIVLVVFLQIVGPVVYFIFGRGEDDGNERA